MKKKGSANNPVSAIPLRVLLLEDDPHDVKLMMALLRDSGYKLQFDVTDQARTFSKLLEKADYDLILADFNMRGWTALDALDLLKSLQKEVPLIVLTGSLGEEAAVECIRRGAADFVLKDRPARLPAAVQHALEQSRLRAEKKIAEDAFHEERHLFLTLMDNLPDVVYFKDWEGRFLQINQSLARRFGLANPVEAIGKTDFDFYLPEHAMPAQADELEIIRSGKPIVGKEEKEVWPDGRVTWVFTTKMPLRDAGGRIVGTFGVSRDITDRKQAAELLRESEERFRATFEDAGIGMALVDMEGRSFKTNAMLRRMLGYSDEEFSRLAFTEFTHPDDRNLDWEQFSELVHGKRNFYEIQKRYIKKDASLLWALLTVSMIRDATNAPVYAVGMVQDITERKRAEDALRESEERFRATFEDAGIGMALVDMRGRAFKTNAAFRKMLGYNEEEAFNMTFTDYTHPDDREKDWNLFAELTAGKRERYEIEKRLIKKGGDILTGLLTVSLVNDRQGSPLCAMRMTQDITERKHAEASLRESEERYRTLFERNLAGVFCTTWDGRILDCNQAMADILGFASPQEAMFHHVNEIYASPEDRLQFLDRLQQEGRLTNYEMRLYRRDGKPVWLIGNISVLPQTTTGLRIIEGTLIDITERKIAEAENARLAAVVQASDNAIFSTTPEGMITTWNPGAERIYGHPAKDMIGKSFIVLVPEEHLPEVARISESLLRGTGLEHVEQENLRKDGSKFHASLTLSPIKNEAGLVTGVSVIVQDITERKRAERALWESEEKYRSIVSNVPDVVWTLDANLRFTFISRNIEKMSGFTLEEIDRHGPQLYLSSLHPEDVPKVKNGLRALFNEGRPYDVEVRVRRKTGEWVWLHDRALATYEKDGVRFADGLLSDITERKRSEEELQFQTALLEAQAETTIDGILVVDAADKILFMNQRFGDLWNLPDALRSECDDRKMLAHVGPQLKDAESFLARVSYLNAHPSENSRDEIELRDGRIFDRYSSPLQGRPGRNYGRVWYFRDITERKRAEAERIRLVTAIEQSAEAVMITDPDAVIEYINPAFSEITGYTRVEALGQTPRILKSGKQDQEFYRDLWETLVAGKPWHGELINRRKDGSFYNEEMSVAPVKDKQGKVTHFIATKEDITERRALELQLQQATKMEAVGRLAGGVAHDFNNLLTVINGYSEILQSRLSSDPTAVEYVREIYHAGESAASLTRQLLAFSRRQVMAPRILDLNGSVTALEKMLRRLIGEHIGLQTNLDPDLAMIKADPGQIEQVIINLAVNARDAIDAGGDISIETRNVELDENYARKHPEAAAGRHVMLAVTDTGRGMAPETIERIFEPFFTTKELGKGTGLGLATVYGIVKQSGGSIYVYSELGQGTVFKVYFPVAGETSSEAEPAVRLAQAHVGTETILLIEDEEGVRSLVTVALRSAGYTVLEAADPDAALELCSRREVKIDLILSDVVMPKMSGPAVAERAAKLRPGVKVLFMSGYTDDSIVRHGLMEQNMPFIQKPFTPDGLRKKIREVLGSGTAFPA
jgi:PAS domain S-box-containing protein